MQRLDRNIYQRIFGRPATKPPGDYQCWNYRDGIITVDLNKAGELNKIGGAVYLFDKILSDKIIVVCDEYESFHAFRGRCRHKEKNDGVSGLMSACCAVNDGARDRDDTTLTVIPEDCIETYRTERVNGTLTIFLK